MVPRTTVSDYISYFSKVIICHIKAISFLAPFILPCLRPRYIIKLYCVLIHRYLKFSSPYVNILIVVGAIMFYIVVILFGVDENTASFDTVDGLCHTRIWLCVFAFTLLCGTIIAKLYRAYYTFHHSKSKVCIKISFCFPLGLYVTLLTDV